MAVVSIKNLFEAGAHLGHKTRKWHPKMKPYIFGAQSGIYIIDLRQTLQKLKEAYEHVLHLSSNGGKILFVGTKFQARDVVKEQALRSDNYYVNLRWLGGMLTNFSTIKQSITKLKSLEDEAGPDGDYVGILKKEAVRKEKSRRKLENILGGIAELRKRPAAVYIVDIRREFIALNEAKKLGIPVIAAVDTNCDPRKVDFIIPGNDDSIHCINLFTSVIAAASIEGRKKYETKVQALKIEKDKAAAEKEAIEISKKAKEEEKLAAKKAKEEEKLAAKKPKKKPVKPEETAETAEKTEVVEKTVQEPVVEAAEVVEKTVQEPVVEAAEVVEKTVEEPVVEATEVVAEAEEVKAEEVAETKEAAETVVEDETSEPIAEGEKE